MKLIFKQYLEELNEREELDAIMPDLLSELGFNILTTPSRGTRQHGVDIAAIGMDEEDNNIKKLFLFSLKPGNVTRSIWDNDAPQAIRPSLREILDVYVVKRIAKEHQELDVVICLCIGGEIREEVRDQWTGFVTSHTTSKICFREWNGDKISGLLISGLLGKEFVLPRTRSYFQKSIALVDQPEVSYRHFVTFIDSLLTGTNEQNIVKSIRQIYICCWALLVWARAERNLDAPFRAVEYFMLKVWDLGRTRFNKKIRIKKAFKQLLLQTIELHIIVADEMLITKFSPYLNTQFAFSLAVKSSSNVDVNLALFEQFGRMCVHGIWLHWMASKLSHEPDRLDYERKREHSLDLAITMVAHNPTLLSPLCDDFMIEIVLFSILANLCNRENSARQYLILLIEQLDFAIESRRKYPTPTNDYYRLLHYDDDRSEEHFKNQTLGSILYPMLTRLCNTLGLSEQKAQLVRIIQTFLPHTTQQIFFLNEDSDENIWKGDIEHGTTVVDVPLCRDEETYENFFRRCIADHNCFTKLSCTTEKYIPILLTACRLHRIPVPPQLWSVEPTNIGV